MKSFLFSLKSKVRVAISYFRGIESIGFTLIELLIVVSVLGILSGVMYVVINPEAIRGTARDSVRLSNVRKLVEAVESYANMEGTYSKDKATLISSTYLANWPTDEPLQGDSYTYTYDRVTNSFEVYTQKSDLRYYVYPSDEGKIMDCPTPTYTSDCGALTPETDMESYAVAQAKMDEFYDAVVLARQKTGLTLLQITGNAWTRSPCRNRDLRNIPDTDACYVGWIRSRDRVDVAAGPTVDLSTMGRDSWGSPYLLDENEREFGSTDCRLDAITIAGADGVWISSDDYTLEIPPATPCPTPSYTSDAQSEMGLFAEAVRIAENASGKVLGQITGTFCSACAGCRSGEDLRNVPESNPCYIRWVLSLKRISEAAGGTVDLSGLKRDPWGSPYSLDENEFEWSPDRCRLDRIMTVGPNGIWESSGDGLVGMGDGQGLLMPFASSECAD